MYLYTILYAFHYYYVNFLPNSSFYCQLIEAVVIYCILTREYILNVLFVRVQEIILEENISSIFKAHKAKVTEQLIKLFTSCH